VIALLLALGSSLAYGCADFLGGLGARKAHVLRTVLVAAPASLAVELLLWPVLGAAFGSGALAWGAASGVASAAAFALLYRTPSARTGTATSSRSRPTSCRVCSPRTPTRPPCTT
jgi:hypothetical protein